MGTDVADKQVNVAHIALARHIQQLFDIIGLEQQAGKSLQGAATNTDTANVRDVVAITLYQRCACTHAYHNDSVATRLIAGTKTIGDKFFHLVGGQSIDGLFDVCTSHSRKHHMLHILQLDLVVVKILAKGTIERCHRVGGLDSDRREHLAVAYSHNLGGTDAHINSYYYSHNRSGCKVSCKEKPRLIINRGFYSYAEHNIVPYLFHFLNNGLERLRIVDSEVSKHLTVDFDTSLVQSAHEC